MRGETHFTRDTPSTKPRVKYFEVDFGLLKYHVFLDDGEYKLCNAGDYLITDVGFDTIEGVLEYIGKGEKF